MRDAAFAAHRSFDLHHEERPLASVFREKSGNYRLQVLLNGEDRRSHALGKLNKKQAATVLQRIDSLELAVKSGTDPDVDTMTWLKKLDNELFLKLTEWGYVPPTVSDRLNRIVTLKEAIADCRKNAIHKPGTQLIWDQVEDRAFRHFGETKAIQSMTLADAKSFRTWLLTAGWDGDAYADATTRKTIGIMRQVFTHAKDREWIEKNPFADKSLPTNVRSNKARKVYIEQQTVLAVMDECQHDELRLIVALTRFAGLRCNSEHLRLRWVDINWDLRRMLVTSPKTEHHEGKGTRMVPIVDEVFALLEKMYDGLSEPTEFVINRYRKVKASYIWKLVNQAATRAGFTPWPRLFNAMRSSRQTDWAEEFPRHVACEWMGNSEDVADEHYLTVKDKYFERAVDSGSRAIRVQTTRTRGNSASQADSGSPGNYGAKLRVVNLSDLAGNVSNSPARIRT